MNEFDLLRQLGTRIDREADPAIDVSARVIRQIKHRPQERHRSTFIPGFDRCLRTLGTGDLPHVGPPIRSTTAWPRWPILPPCTPAPRRCRECSNHERSSRIADLGERSGGTAVETQLPPIEPNRARRWTSAGLGLVIFLAGIICGGAHMRTFLNPSGRIGATCSNAAPSECRMSSI